MEWLEWPECLLKRLPHHPSVPNQAIPLKEPLKADKSALNLL
jgi:hypothetical protein